MRTTLHRLSLTGLAFTALLLVLASPSRGGLSQQQRAQQTVYILVNVTGVGSRAPATAPAVIAARFAMRGKGSQPSVDASEVNGLSNMVAQTQQAVRVQAEVTPNPNATLLVTNQTNIVLNGTAGTTVTASLHLYRHFERREHFVLDDPPRRRE